MTAVAGGGRPIGGYHTEDGTRVPSVTTITGYLKGAALVQWAYKRGRDGLELYGSRDEAAATGSIVHQWIEDDIYGLPLTNFDVDTIGARTQLEEARTGFAAYTKWRGTTDLVILETEVPLVSEEHGYGGTLDAVAILNGERVLFDWKTSNGTYPDYIAQLAAYRQLLWERDNTGPTDAVLLRVGKEFGDFHVHSWPSNVLDLGWEWFLAAKTLYELDKRLKKVAS